MKNTIIVIVAILVILFIWIQWRKKKRQQAVDTSRDVPQAGDTSLSNVATVRGDVSTAQDQIDNNAGTVKGSSTADNPIVRENSTSEISLVEELGGISVAAVPKVPINTPITPANTPAGMAFSPGTIITDAGVITNQDQIDHVAQATAQGIVATIPPIGSVAENSSLWTNISNGDNTWTWKSVDGKLSFVSDVAGRRIA